MLLQKTIRAKVYRPTNRKLSLLEGEYREFQRELHGEPSSLYSATKQQAQRLRRRLGRRLKKDREYPLILRRDCYRVEVRDTRLVKAWVRVPVHGARGGVWLPVQVPYH